jgi:hypothetical protein
LWLGAFVNLFLRFHTAGLKQELPNKRGGMTAAAAAAANGATNGAAPVPAPARAPETAEVAIVGMGIAGISVACRLQQAGIGPLVAFERAGSVGGTWAVNTYPGAACDVPAHLYSLSFAHNFDWSRMFATQGGASSWHC